MKEKQKGVTAPETQRKDNTISLKMQVLSLLKNGEKITVKATSRYLNCNDVRKAISALRKDGYIIGDYWSGVGNRRHKIYFLVPDNQLSLFEKGCSL